jgi:hypothetical protein
MPASTEVAAASASMAPTAAMSAATVTTATVAATPTVPSSAAMPGEGAASQYCQARDERRKCRSRSTHLFLPFRQVSRRILKPYRASPPICIDIISLRNQKRTAAPMRIGVPEGGSPEHDEPNHRRRARKTVRFRPILHGAPSPCSAKTLRDRGDQSPMKRIPPNAHPLFMSSDAIDGIALGDREAESLSMTSLLKRLRSLRLRVWFPTEPAPASGREADLRL